MDGAHLARWTRFAAKGGIGKCTAVQDCIAESPEDLMFLKDDEITVLMQLPSQTGWYLGYCEGVVGRFQGAHVRLHDKLKRPVKTKRSSASAMSAASTPVPSATPSPRTQFSSLSGTTFINDTPDHIRDSTSLSNPFDLEFDSSMEAKEDSFMEGRQRRRRTKDDLPGLEMFLPRSRSGSRSRPSSTAPDRPMIRSRSSSQHPLNGSPLVRAIDTPPSPLPITSSPQPMPAPENNEPTETRIPTPPSEPTLILDTPAKETIPTRSSEPRVEATVPDHDSEAESSRLYDASSIRSSFYSMRSYRSSVIGTNMADVLGAPERLSKVESDDGALGMGIGLSMLQGMTDDDDDDASIHPPKGKSPEAASTSEDTATRVDEGSKGTNGDSNGTELNNHPEPEGDEGDENDSDDSDNESYWDGADIYDNYRYSRYSMMTKGSRRKSRFSMFSTADSPQSEIPPMPKDGDGFLHAEAYAGSPARETFNAAIQERRKIPPPLNLPSGPSNAEPSLLSPNATNTANNREASPIRADAGNSPQPSPLLHTSFASPHASSQGSTYSQSFETPEASPSPSVLSFNGPGAASTLRQRLENDKLSRPSSPAQTPSLEPKDFDFSRRERGSEDPSEVGKSIVVEDEEEVNVTVVAAEDGAPPNNDELSTRESFQSLASQSSIVTTTSEMSDNVSSALRKLERDLAGDLPDTTAEVDMEETSSLQTPTVTTAPLRLHQDKSGSQTTLSPPNTRDEMPNPHGETSPVQRDPPPAMPSSQFLQPQQALFLPHPNAPRPNPAVVSGQRQSTYGMPPQRDMNVVQNMGKDIGVPPNSLQTTLRQAAANRIGPAGIPHRPTIYGRTVVDLQNADGPVPIMWSLQPFPPDPIAPPSRTNSPLAGNKPLRRAPTNTSSPLSQNITSPQAPPKQGSLDLKVVGRVSQDAPVSNGIPHGSGLVIPRPGFSPQVGAARPRSRSFSGFDRPPQVDNAVADRTAGPAIIDDQRKPARVASIQSLNEPMTTQKPRQASGSFSGRAIVPSPLSRSQNNSISSSSRSLSISRGVSSPLSRSTFSLSQTELPAAVAEARPSQEEDLQRPSMSALGIRQVSSVDTLKSTKSTGSEGNLVKPPTSLFQPVRRNSGPSDPSSSNASPSNSATSAPSPIQRLRRLSSPTSKKHQRSTSQQSHASSTNSDMRSIITSPTSTSNPIKSKISLAHLRIRNSTIKEGGSETQSTSPSTTPGTPYEYENQPVRVQDAEFEMIRPTVRRMSSEPASDSSVIERDERASLQQEGRVESPAPGSVHSALSPMATAPSDPHSPIVPSSPVKTPEDASVHRAREQKWMSMMSAVPAAQARKSKKVRRLVLEGVPSSVRYLVWSHLTDSKSRQIPKVYGEVGKRDNVPAKDIIERDASRLFPDQAHLQDPKGPLVNLLKTYTILVPDLEYQSSLALVAGHLCLQSPEEDGFWTFVAMMDTQLRSYYSNKSVQLDADALVFAKQTEALFPAIHKKLFVDMSIPPIEICRMWLPSLFSATLPQKYTNRIWDIYFCEGPPFLFRVALALLSFSRKAIEASRDRTSVLTILAKPEVMSLLPDEPDELINAAMSLKVKDDDINKQRVKMESQLRQQAQSATRTAPRLLSSISLPRPKMSLQAS